MARVSDASRSGPEGGRSAPSPLGREGAEGLSKLMRSVGGSVGLSVPFVSSSSRSAFVSAMSGVSKSYLPESIVGRSFKTGASSLTGAGGKEIGVTGRGEGTFATKGVSPASWTVRAPWITGAELVAAFLAVGALLSAAWSTGLLLSKAVRLLSL